MLTNNFGRFAEQEHTIFGRPFEGRDRDDQHKALDPESCLEGSPLTMIKGSSLERELNSASSVVEFPDVLLILDFQQRTLI